MNDINKTDAAAAAESGKLSFREKFSVGTGGLTVSLGNQSVLLAGVNDSVHIQRKLVHELVKIRVRTYYLYQCDLVEGSGHFRTSISKGIEIMEGLRGHTSGYAVPTYIIDGPGGGGKIPAMPNYVISQSPGKTILRNYEGFITTYREPLDYDPEAIDAQERLIERRAEPGQEGVLGLLEGQRMTIEPSGFGDVHARGGQAHRLRSGEQDQKWQPLGVGAIEPDPAMLKQIEAPDSDDEADAKGQDNERPTLT